MDAGELDSRLEAVGELKESHQRRADLRASFEKVYDLERLISRVSLGAANARDLLALKQSFTVLPDIRALLADCSAALLKDLAEGWDDLGRVPAP